MLSFISEYYSLRYLFLCLSQFRQNNDVPEHCFNWLDIPFFLYGHDHSISLHKPYTTQSVYRAKEHLIFHFLNNFEQKVVPLSNNISFTGSLSKNIQQICNFSFYFQLNFLSYDYSFKSTVND